MFPPGLRLTASPARTGSPIAIATTGIVVVACLAARLAGVPHVASTSTGRPTSSAAAQARRSARTLRHSSLNDDVATFDVTVSAQPPAEVIPNQPIIDDTDARDLGCQLCARGKRPHNRPTNQSNELPPPHPTPLRYCSWGQRYQISRNAMPLAAPQWARIAQGRGRDEDCTSPPASGVRSTRRAHQQYPRFGQNCCSAEVGSSVPQRDILHGAPQLPASIAWPTASPRLRACRGRIDRCRPAGRRGGRVASQLPPAAIISRFYGNEPCACSMTRQLSVGRVDRLLWMHH